LVFEATKSKAFSNMVIQAVIVVPLFAGAIREYAPEIS